MIFVWNTPGIISEQVEAFSIFKQSTLTHIPKKKAKAVYSPFIRAKNRRFIRYLKLRILTVAEKQFTTSFRNHFDSYSIAVTFAAPITAVIILVVAVAGCRNS